MAGVACALAIAGAAAITGQALPMPWIALPAAFAAVVGAVVLTNWRAGVYLFLAWVVVEDLPRKFLGNDMRLYFAKDVVALLLYLAFWAWGLRGRETRPSFRFLAPLAVFAAWGLLQVFNPRSPSPIYGLLGLRMYFFYIPLLLVGYALVRSGRDLGRFLLFNLALAAVVAGLGIAQGIVGLVFLNPAELAPELHLARLVRQAPITGALVPRPTSVFVSDGRFAWYMLVAFLLGLGGTAYALARRDRRGLTLAAATGIVAAAIVVSGSRGTFMYALGSTAVLAAALLWGASRPLRARMMRGTQLVLLGIGLGIVLVLVLFPEAVGARWAFYYETVAPWSPTSELAWRVWGYPVANLLGAFSFPGWLLGYGIGTSSLGVQYVTGLLGLPAPEIGVESGYGTLILELGILGPLLWLMWTIALVREGWTVLRRLRGSALFPVGAAVLWFAFLLLFPFTFGGMQPYQNFVFNAYLWLLVGILFRLPALARR
ncbi:MAG: hypothetical protein QN120_13515 [Armatimonadota bacterium]|nr:hypothetical protein [Armatimonadota bacterium]